MLNFEYVENCKIYNQYRGTTTTNVPVARSHGITVNLVTRDPAMLQRSLSPLLQSNSGDNADYRDPQFPIPVQFSRVTSCPWAELYGKQN